MHRKLRFILATRCSHLFTMVRKSGDLQQTKAGNQYLLSRSHTMFFTKMLHDRLQPLRETEQSMDQVGFRKGPGIDHALAGFETVCRKNIEWNSKIWFASLDLTKAFGRVAQGQLFQALGSNMFRNLPWTCRGRSVLLKLARRTEVGLWIFNVELQKTGRHPHPNAFHWMLLWNVPCGSGRENVDIMALAMEHHERQTSGTQMIWCRWCNIHYIWRSHLKGSMYCSAKCYEQLLIGLELRRVRVNGEDWSYNQCGINGRTLDYNPLANVDLHFPNGLTCCQTL